MTEYETFLVYKLDDSGERKKADIKEEELQSNLLPEQVLVIVREDLRRIFIWKGPKSPVRKRFISSRVATALQEELRMDSRYHRCKIVSVDAGDEPTEFLDAFQLEPMEITETLPDMRYVRNIERERMAKTGIIARDQKAAKAGTEEEYFSPALQDISGDVVVSSLKAHVPSARSKAPLKEPSMIKPPAISKQLRLSDEENQKIKEKILKIEVPNNYKRLNLILGNTLFAAVSKTAKVFGKDVEETEWESVKKVPKGMMELDNHILRVYFDQKKGIVEAVEVLEKEEKSKPPEKKAALKKKPVPKPPTKKAALKKKPAPKPPTKKTAPKKKPSMTPMPPKPASMKTTPKKTGTGEEQSEEKQTKPKISGRRQLPKIPSKEE